MCSNDVTQRMKGFDLFSCKATGLLKAVVYTVLTLCRYFLQPFQKKIIFLITEYFLLRYYFNILYKKTEYVMM